MAFFDMFRFGGSGILPPIIFVVFGPVGLTIKVSSQIWKKNYINLMTSLDNDVIMVRKLAEKTVKRD